MNIYLVDFSHSLSESRHAENFITRKAVLTLGKASFNFDPQANGSSVHTVRQYSDFAGIDRRHKTVADNRLGIRVATNDLMTKQLVGL